jgi:hypothetical protein
VVGRRVSPLSTYTGPGAHQVIELIKESKQAIACVSGKSVPADEFDMRQAAEAAVGYPHHHSACQEWESAAEAKTQEDATLDQVVNDYRHIHDTTVYWTGGCGVLRSIAAV